jgi:serine/threonine-protein kinase HipA
MKQVLDVYLGEGLVGRLTQDANGLVTFAYAQTWLADPQSMPLSRSLPLREKPFSRNECVGFFAGILPEEGKRSLVARNLGVSANNDFALLDKIGGECAGAVTFLPAGQSPSPRSAGSRRLSASELARFLRELPRRPLLAGESGVRLSLAGAQDKLVVRIIDGEAHLPLDATPSTHILKPAVGGFPGIVQNEAFCLRLAAAVGIATAGAEVAKVEDVEYLRVERYDRVMGADGQPTRVHQEDFCQALNFPPVRKYQDEGGPSLKQCFALVRTETTEPIAALGTMLSAVLFNCLIGNHDAHGKNFSLLYTHDAAGGLSVSLAPLYDLICTVRYEGLSPHMAMRVGGEYDSAKLGAEQFNRFAEEIGMSAVEVRRRVLDLADKIAAKVPEVAAGVPGCEPVAELVLARCRAQASRLRG